MSASAELGGVPPSEGSAGEVLGATPPAPPAVPTSSVAEWAQELGDPATQAFIGTKGWQSPEAMIESYKNLESHMGTPEGSLLKLKGIDDRDAWHGENGIFAKLGRPARAEDYELPGGLDEGLAAKFRDLAFQDGLTQQQVGDIATWFAQEGNAGAEAAQLAAQATQQQELQQVKGEWGPQWETNVATARAGMAALGITPEMATAMESQVGTRELLHKMLNVGKLLHGAQHGSHGENTMPALTPAEAEREVNRLKSDDQFMEKWLQGSEHEVQKLRSLLEIAHPGLVTGAGGVDVTTG